MILELTIPDELYEIYKEFDPKDPEKVIVEQLKRHRETSPRGRGLVVPAKQRLELEKFLQKHIETTQELVNSVKTALELSIGDVSVALTPDLLNQIRDRANWNNSNFEEYLVEKAPQALQLVADGAF